MKKLEDYSLESILDEAQRMQRETFGMRHINISTAPSYLNIVIFERDYDKMEDGDLRNFTFYDFMDGYAREAEWERLMDYYNG